jgi:hypothetical protein
MFDLIKKFDGREGGGGVGLLAANKFLVFTQSYAFGGLCGRL